MKYDKAFFDAGIERKHTRCVKWDAGFIGPDDLPMWVADWDFACPEPIVFLSAVIESDAQPCASARSTPATAITATIRVTRPPFAATGSVTMT